MESELLGLAGHIAAAQCRFLQLLAEFDRRDGWAGPGLRSCAHWLSWKAGMSLRTAIEQVRVAHALAKLPRVTEAFAAGRISYSKVRAITRVADHPVDQPQPEQVDDDPKMPDQPGPRWAPAQEVEQTLLQVALGGTASHLETVVRAVRRRPADPAKAQAARSLSWAWADDGSLVLRGRLAPAEGATLVAAIETLVPATATATATATRPEPRERPPDWQHRAVEHAPGAAADRVAARRADALLTLIDTATDLDSDADLDDLHPDDPDHGDGRDIGSEADAAAGVIDADTGASVDDEASAGKAGGCGQRARPGRGRRGAQPTTRHNRRRRHTPRRPVVRRGQAKVIVHIDAATGTARIPGGPELPPAAAERLGCDAQVQLLLPEPRSNRLYLGRTRRLASPAQIAALTIRDHGRCRFPGCTHTRHLHAHHARPWWAGGPTDLDNLVLVCPFHHQLIHDRGYQIRWTGHRWQALRPDGTDVPEAGRPLAGNLDGLVEHATRSGQLITDRSLTPTWYGETLDPAPILDTLLPRHVPAATAA
ncbi:HNH endonuclease signature motif containing protein [Pseudonocardia aurantiaca]